MDDTETENKKILEEYRIWKKNAPFLYDLVMTHVLPWPSLTVQWLPAETVSAKADYVAHDLVLGTHTNDTEQNFLMIAKVRIPTADAEIDPSKYAEERGEFGGFGNDKGRIDIHQVMFHDGEVNRARVMPLNHHIIATQTVSGETHIFDKSKHSSNLEFRDKPSERHPAKPQLRLVGHKAEGYGLDWNPHQSHKSYVVSGNDDGLVCVWDIARGPAAPSGQSLDPLHSFSGHNMVVGDVAFHRVHESILGSVGDDGRLWLWDLRTAAKASASPTTVSQQPVNAISFNPFREHIIATGDAEGAVKLWDMRNLRASLHSMEVHRDEVLSVHWCPHSESVLASSSVDRRVMVWDMARIGEEQTAEDAEDGPPELLFIHSGHTARVNDISWNPNAGSEWILASVAEDNIVQVWQMAEGIYMKDVDTSLIESAAAVAKE